MSRYFPLFVNLEGKQILVFGAGVIAERRVKSLLDFGSRLLVAAPEASEEIKRLAAEGKLVWEQRVYLPGEIGKREEMPVFALAATDNAGVNEQIWKECKEAGIPVNVSSDKNKCDFYFPGLVTEGNVVIGVTAGGENHRLAKELTEKIRREVTEHGNEC